MKFTRIKILFFHHLLFVLPLTLGFAFVSFADSSENKIVDTDHDGLIEISSLQQLDEIRHSLVGTRGFHLSWNTQGCPDDFCHGYELVADLDFDTNGNGIIDEGEAYWNDGAGWIPIGDQYNPFYYGIFKGNNHKNLNLYINRIDLMSTVREIPVCSLLPSKSTSKTLL
jgi:hypothetical protein